MYLILGFFGGRRRRLYRAILDRLFNLNPKNDLCLVFFKKLTIGPNSGGSKLLHKSCFISNFDSLEFVPMVNI